MTRRRFRTLPLALTLIVLAAMLLAACGQATEPEGSGSETPAPAESSSAPAAQAEPLPLGEPATLGAYAFTPTALHERDEAVYDEQGELMKGSGVQVAIAVEKLREPETGGGEGAGEGGGGELAIPVARLANAQGETVQMDHLLGLPPAQAQSTEFNDRYTDSFQYACIQPVGTVTKAVLWFSLPEGFAPETLTIDAGAGRQAAWRLD